MLSANQIASLFFDHQYLCKESVNILDFFHGDIRHWKETSEGTIFGWVWSAMPKLVKICQRFIWVMWGTQAGLDSLN